MAKIKQARVQNLCVLLLSACSILSAQSVAGSSNVIYPKLKNNGTTWYNPSPPLRSYYNNYFSDMDRTYKQQIIGDKRFSASLLNVCGETSALFYRYLKNKVEKPLYIDSTVKTNGLQKREGLPFIGTNSQYYKSDMYVEYPTPTNSGKYQGQFVYEYKITGGKKSFYQLNKNLGGGNGKNEELVFLSFLSIYYINEKGNKGRLATKSPFYVILKIDKLTRINKASSENDAFKKGKSACSWMSKKLK